MEKREKLCKYYKNVTKNFESQNKFGEEKENGFVNYRQFNIRKQEKLRHNIEKKKMLDFCVFFL